MIGFFGDSYIDVSNRSKPSYPLILRDTLGNGGDFYGTSGTSHWNAYEKFIKNYHKYDIIVFSHTNVDRWPHLPIEEEGHNYNIGYDWLPTNEFMSHINRVYTDIFTDDLLNFICKSIYDNVNKICRDNNIYLINIIPFELEYDYTNTEFPIIEGLDELSRREEIVIDGKKELFVKWMSRQAVHDIRRCHLNTKNNMRMHDIIKNLIENKTTNVSMSTRDFEWDLRDIELESELTDEMIERQKYLRK